LDEGEWDTLDEAIGWARERAASIHVRVGYSDYYSAGDRPSGEPPWPPAADELRLMGAAYPRQPEDVTHRHTIGIAEPEIRRRPRGN